MSLESDSVVSAWLRAQEKKDLLRFVVIGSVDDGKSTLIGRLLHDAQGLYQDQLEAVRRASVKGATRGAGSTAEIDFSLVTDGLMAEREQGITIDVAYRYFATEKRKFIIADTPGHVQYTRNMATGASTADAAVILVDARLGVLPQTRRHLQIAALLGIRHVVACVNKMDLVGFDLARYAAIAEELGGLAQRLGIPGLVAIPVSALAGDNIVTESARLPWTSPARTLIGHLESLDVGGGTRALPFRLPVQLVLRPGVTYRGFAGQITSGTVSVGDEVIVLPSGRTSRVASVDVAGENVSVACAPMSVALRLADEIDISRGDLLASPGDLPTIASTFEADIVWMSERPLDRDKTYVLRHTTRTVRADIDVIHGTNAETLEPKAAPSLALNDVGRVRVKARAPLAFDAYRDNRATGAFIVIDAVTNDTVAAGMIAHATTAGAQSLVSTEERRARLGHSGHLVTLSTRSIEEARERAYRLERDLFDRGVVAIVVGAEGAGGVVRAGLVAIVTEESSTERTDLDGEVLASIDPDALAQRFRS